MCFSFLKLFKKENKILRIKKYENERNDINKFGRLQDGHGNDFLITPNFSYLEMTETSHRDFIEKNRDMTAYLLSKKAGKDLCEMLERVRANWGLPLIPSSGYRCKGLNKKIGGSPTSQHVKFEACDFTIPTVPLTEVFEWIWKKSDLPFGQLILEGYVQNVPRWIHLSLGEPYRDKIRCRDVKKAVYDSKKKKYIYTKLIDE